MRRFTAKMLLAVCLLSVAPAMAAEPSETPRDAEAIEREIAEAQAKLERLMVEARGAEQRAADEEALAYLRTLADDRLTYTKAEIEELGRPSEYGPPSPAQLTRIQSRRTYLESCRKIDEKIVSLKGASSLRTAQELQESRDMLDLRWAIVTGPTTDRAVLVESLQDYAAASSRASEMLAALKQLHEKDSKDAEADFAMRTQRIQTEKEVARLTQAIYDSPPTD